MFNLLKRLLPLPVKKRLRYLKSVSIDQCYKKYLSIKMQRKHQILIKKASKKSKIKVVFLAFHQSTWKVDTVFNKMLNDPFFEPLILVCPYTVYGEEKMWQEMSASLDFFKSKQYPVLSSFNQTTKKWITLDELDTDIVFFTNPHNLTKKEYYQDAYLNYLSCYVPYHHEVDKENFQFNQNMHNAMWLVFASHQEAANLYRSLSSINNKHIIVSGYPALENINDLPASIPTNKKMIIYAPHHEIGDERPYSTFLLFAHTIKDLACKYQDSILFVFKPHPILKSKLYIHPDWGVKKTNAYYDFWEENPNTILCAGEYLNLFKSSDAMIHDCGSFLFEYLYFKKPFLYLLSKLNKKSQYNQLGSEVLNTCMTGSNENDIESFIRMIKHGTDDSHVTSTNILFEKNFNNLLETPSSIIISSIKNKISLEKASS